MKDILVFQHDPLEELGIFAQLLERQKLGFHYIRLFQGEVPEGDWEQIGGLVVLGGPMAAYEEERYPYLKWEKTILRSAIKQKIPLLGICLGAQLIAAALGTRVYQSAFKEIGWYPVTLTLEGQLDSLLGYLPAQPTVFQWHAGTFDLPGGALRLAYSANDDNQAFRIGKSVYGLQFHLEVTPVMIERWIDTHRKELAQAPYVSPEKIRADTFSYSETLRYFGERFFSMFIQRAISARLKREEGQVAKG